MVGLVTEVPTLMGGTVVGAPILMGGSVTGIPALMGGPIVGAHVLTGGSFTVELVGQMSTVMKVEMPPFVEGGDWQGYCLYRGST